MIFDTLSDLLYLKCDKNFLDHIKEMAASQGLSSPCDANDDKDNAFDKKEVLVKYKYKILYLN